MNSKYIGKHIQQLNIHFTSEAGTASWPFDTHECVLDRMALLMPAKRLDLIMSTSTT